MNKEQNNTPNQPNPLPPNTQHQSPPLPHNATTTLNIPPSAVSITENGEGTVSRREKKWNGGGAVNSFIHKTYTILMERKYENIISWNDSLSTTSPTFHAEGTAGVSQGEVGKGTFRCNSFRIHNVKTFEEVVLPQYFKHSNMSSFVRQVNHSYSAQHVQLSQSKRGS